MAASGLLCIPASIRASSAQSSYLSHKQISIPLSNRAELRSILFSKRNRNEEAQKGRWSVNASLGDMADDPRTAVFPRINVRDPYKRLGISRDASEEEIQAARSFLINKYAHHKPSVDAIESAHNKIIIHSLYEKRSSKIDVKKKMKELSQSRGVLAIISRFGVPSTDFIVMTSTAFIILGVLTVLLPTEDGPTLQVACSLMLSMYFIYKRLKSGFRAILYSIAIFVGSWLLGTLLMVSVIPPLIEGPQGFEVTTSLITYVLLWISSTYLK